MSVVHEPPSATSSLGFVSHPYHRGGVTRWMADAFAEWARRGQPTWFVTPRPQAPFASGGGRPTVAELLAEVQNGKNAHVSTPQVSTLFELGTSGFRASEYERAIRSAVPPGVPLILSDDPDVWAGAALVGDRNPLVGVLHADDEAYYALARTYGRSLVGAVAVSSRIESRAEPILREHGIPLATIPCGIAIPPRAAGSSAPYARIIWVGRVEERQKRVSDLYRIAAELVRRDVQFRLAIVGDGPEKDSLSRQFAEQQLGGHVQFLGWLAADRVRRLFEESDVLVLPSNFEGMPVVVMEALAAGCAVVASRVSGVEDYESDELAQSVLGLHDVGDIDAAAESIVHAIEQPRPQRREAARRFAESEFSIARCMDRYALLLASLPRRVTSTAQPPGSARRALTFAGATGVAVVRAVRRLLPS